MSFDPIYYKNNYKQFNFDSNYKYYLHWINNGIYEGLLPNDKIDNLKFYKPNKNLINKCFNDCPTKKIDNEFGLMINNLSNEKEFKNRCIPEGWISNCSIFYKLFPYSIIKIDENNEYFIYYKNEKYKLKEFKKKFIDEDISYLFRNYEIINNNIFDSKMITLFHVGNIDTGILILYKMNKIDYIKNSGLIININCDLENKTTIINYVKNNFKNNIIVSIPNLGQDISPSLILYNILRKKNIKFDYILKLHTKTNTYWLNLLINGLISKNIKPMIDLMEKENNMGMIGSAKYKIKIKGSKNNRNIMHLNYKNDKIYNSSFIGGTMFLCKKIIFESLIKNNKNIIKRMFIASFYIQDNSPAHALERIFGIECFLNNLEIFTFDNYGNFNFNSRTWINDFDWEFFKKYYELKNLYTFQEVFDYYDNIKNKKDYLININDINKVYNNFNWNIYSKLYHKKRLTKYEAIQDFLLYKGSRYGSITDFYKDFPDFDWKFYVEYVNKRFSVNSEITAIKHFLRKNKEGIISTINFNKKYNFNYKSYLQLNPDLEQNGINNEVKAIRHYIIHGRFENRKIR
jgi:hypothetical protein